MNRNLFRSGALLLGAIVGFASLTLAAKNKTDAAGPSAVVMTITATAKKDAQPPALTRNDLTLFQGKERVQVADMKRGDTLRLAVLIDDSLRSSVASQWNDLRAFLMAQPNTTSVAVAYSRNGSVTVAQDFTTDHALAAKAVRMPLGNLSVATSPYLALQDWIKRWPDGSERSSILLFSSGIDYFRGGPASVDPDLDATIEHAQKKNINIWSIYVPDGGRRGRGSFAGFNWQSNLSRISVETGGQAYFLGLGMPVNLKPYFDEIERNLNNQYLLAFAGNGGQKGKFERVKVTTEVANVQFLTPSEVFLPAVQ
jgi:VWFA-related protein